MCPKTQKCTVSLSQELCDTIDDLSKHLSLSKSRLVETLLRENSTVKEGVAKVRLKKQDTCTSCGVKLGSDKIRINTPTDGAVCVDCWAKEMGKFVEKNPICDS